MTLAEQACASKDRVCGQALAKTSAQYIYIYISGVIRRVGRLLSEVGSKSGCGKQLCKRTVRLLLVLTMVVFSVVPAVAQPEEPKEAGLSLSEEQMALVNQMWDIGTFDNSWDSICYHYRRHCSDICIKTSTVEQYFEKAMAMYHDTLQNPDQYKIVEKTGKGSGEKIYKYTHLEKKTFIIHNGNGTIYSFGGLQKNARKKARCVYENSD